ncbi:MAG: hypothetical protein HZA92_00870 [Verrucomicrobia bacterium]|nr:hypothetical protein [Verrucomicrobiota bacterium]
MNPSNDSSAANADCTGLDLPVLPPEWRRVPPASLERILQLSRWNEPEFHARRREQELREGYRCSVEFILR